jgi:hypothetical protein
MLPSAQEALPNVRAIGPRRSAEASWLGEMPASSAVPRKPMARPTPSRQVSGVLPPGMTASNKADQSGMADTSTLAMPEARYCSAHTTIAFAPHNRNTPVMASVRQSRACDGSRMPSAVTMAPSSSPAVRNRTPANRNGGNGPRRFG